MDTGTKTAGMAQGEDSPHNNAYGSEVPPEGAAQAEYGAEQEDEDDEGSQA